MPGRALEGQEQRSDSTRLEDRIDLYDPVSSAYLGAEVTWFDADGRRLRLETTDAEGSPTLDFYIRLDADGREAEAVYFESDRYSAVREVFTWSEDDRTQTTTYFYDADVASDRTESDRDETGRETSKRYYRADGSQYGAEDVFWDELGRPGGWAFRYVEREGGARFGYVYEREAVDWRRRLRTREDAPERHEVRTVRRRSVPDPWRTALRFGPGTISTDAAETSPSFSADGRVMVFARYEDWGAKSGFLAELGEEGWRTRALTELGPIYNLALSPDGDAIYFVRDSEGARSLHRVRRSGPRWGAEENLTESFGVVGSYVAPQENGDLIFYDAEGSDGPGVYRARATGSGFGRAEVVFAPDRGGPFDPFVFGDRLFVTQCFDAECASGDRNGVWSFSLTDGGPRSGTRIPGLAYGWGFQPVPALGVAVYTDGDDILAVPLRPFVER